MAKSDKTEKPTPKRKRDAREKGQVAKSQDFTSWAALLVGLYLLPFTIGRIADTTAHAFYAFREVSAQPTGDAAVHIFGETLRSALFAILPLLAVVVMTSVLATLGQTGLILTLKPLKPDFKRVSPKAGIQRLFSIRSAWETLKQVLKLTVIITIAWPRAVGLVEELAGHGRLGIGEALPAAGHELLGLVRTIAWTVFILSTADYGYQRYQTSRDMKMTKQEIRDEFKNSEGDQMVKSRIRSLQRSMARNRMLAAAADANVIITNPTHIAVALRYVPGETPAPKVVAVGVNNMAMRIRQVGADADIPIIEAKPLARALWRACDVGDEIPGALYEAVAHVLAFVRRLDKRWTIIDAAKPMELPRAAQVDAALLDAVPKRKKRRRR